MLVKCKISLQAPISTALQLQTLKRQNNAHYLSLRGFYKLITMGNNGFSHLVPLVRGCKSRPSTADPCLPEGPSHPMAARSSDRRPPRFGALPSPCLFPTVAPTKEVVEGGCGGGGEGNSGDSRGRPTEP